jgi:hypothetical protein
MTGRDPLQRNGRAAWCRALPNLLATVLLKETRIVQISQGLHVSLGVDKLHRSPVLMKPPDQVAKENDSRWLNKAEPSKVENELWRPTFGTAARNILC